MSIRSGLEINALKQHAIVWTNDDQVMWREIASLDYNNELIVVLIRPAVNIAVNKSIYNELEITIHVIASKLSRYCDAIRNRLWRHQQNEDRASETRVRCVKIVVFIVIYGFVVSYKKQNNTCTLVKNCFGAHLNVIFVFISLVASQLGK